MNTERSRPRRDYRMMALVLVILATGLIGYLISLTPGRSVPAVATEDNKPAGKVGQGGLAELSAAVANEVRSQAVPDEMEPVVPPAGTKPASDPQTEQIEKILRAAQAKIRAKNYNGAIDTLDAERELVKADLRSYLLMAKALEGKKDYDTARDFYNAVLDRDPYRADAYRGVATTSEALGELDAAVGAMRIFLHVQPNADPQKLKIVQARSALWEWESQLGRGPWGPTKGIPPGFTREELKRDGRGVGIKIPLVETQQADGSMKYEIKAQDKFQLFKP